MMMYFIQNKQNLEKMALIDSTSTASTKSELDFFTVPPTQVVVKRGYWDEINLTNPVSDDGHYEFHVAPDPHYIQLNKNYIYMQLSLTVPQTTQGTPAAVAPINLIGKTFFRQVKLFLNGKLIHDSGDKYAYRSFLETELNYNSDAKQSHLQSALYYFDDKPDSEENAGFKQRVTHFKDNVIVEVTAPLHLDLFLQDRFLINYTDLKLELIRNADNFLLESPGGTLDAKLSVKQMKFYVRKAEILESTALAVEQVLTTTPIRYPIRRVLMMNLHIPSTAQSTPLNTLFSGQLPRRLIFGCVDADAYRGNAKKSPFNFKCYSINEVKVVCGGVTYPSHPLRLDFKNNKYIRAFDQLFEALDMARDNKGNQVSRQGFKNGQCLFAFDLTPDEDDGGHWDLIKEGSTSIEISFTEKIPDTGIEVIVYAEFDNLIMLDKNRNVMYDYTA